MLQLPDVSSLHPVGRRPATGFGRVLGGGARGARRLQHHHRLHSGRQLALAGQTGGQRRGDRGRGSPPRLRFMSCGPAAGCGAAAGAELASSDHLHFGALRAAARLPAWAGGGAAAGWELDGADHFCALRAAVRRLAVAGCWGATPSIPSSHVTKAHPLNCPHPHIATPHAPTYSLTQVLDWNRAPILTGQHPRSRCPSCTPHHIPPAHLSTHPSLTPGWRPRGVGY
jgi:hypothetical protein